MGHKVGGWVILWEGWMEKWMEKWKFKSPQCQST